MARICEITGKRMMTGNNVSHSHTKTRRRFNPNIQKKKFYLKEEDKQLTLFVSTEGLRLIDKHGLHKCVKEARENGYLKK
jgi:large subunit ribosomal protein L28